MFASVLPGIRELRVPLSVGFIWLAIAWVWVGDLIPVQGDAAEGSLIAQFYRLSGALGVAAVLAILTFSAYLVGVMLQAVSLERLFTKPDPRYRLPTLNKSNRSEIELIIHRKTAPFTITKAGTNALHDLLEPPQPGPTRDQDREFASVYKKYMGQDPNPELMYQGIAMQLLQKKLIPHFVARIISDIPITTVQLQMQYKDLFDDWDRARAEAQFRLAVALPLGLLILAVAIRTSSVTGFWSVLIALAGGGATVMLIFKGMQKQAEANDVVVRSIIIKAASAPIFDLIDESYKGFEPQHRKIQEGWAAQASSASADDALGTQTAPNGQTPTPDDKDAPATS